MRCIDADALIVALKRKAPISDSMRVMLSECLQEVRLAPTIELDLMVICDKCGHAIHVKRTDAKGR